MVMTTVEALEEVMVVVVTSVIVMLRMWVVFADGYSGADGPRILAPGALTKGPKLFVRTLQGCSSAVVLLPHI